MIPTQPSPWASIREAADHLRCSERTIRRAAREGRLATHRVGRRLLVRYEDLDALAGVKSGETASNV